EAKAVAKGKVVYIDRSRESGNTIIIDHGDHYYSVYSYVDDPAVKLDEEVQEGQVLAKSVHNHPFFGEGLYFEMRHFSEPIDPAKWLAFDHIKSSTRRVR